MRIGSGYDVSDLEYNLRAFFQPFHTAGRTSGTSAPIEISSLAGYHIGFRAFDDFVRMNISDPARAGFSLDIDIAPGVQTPWGETLELPSATGTRRIVGGEIWARSEDASDYDIRSPIQAFASYLTGTMKEYERLRKENIWYRTPVSAIWQLQIAEGGQGNVGGLLSYNPAVHSAAARQEFSERLGLAGASDVWMPNVLNDLYDWAYKSDPKDPMIRALRSYLPWQEEDKRIRLRKLSIGEAVVDESGDWAIPFGVKNASSILKRAPISYMGGLREEAGVFHRAQTPGGADIIARSLPQPITSAADRAGYRQINMLFPGEGTPRGMVVRPNTIMVPGTPVPGAMISYEDIMKGHQAAGYPTHEKFKLGMKDVRDLAGYKFEFGIFKETARGQYERQTEGLAGQYIPANDSAIIGLYHYDRPYTEYEIQQAEKRGEPIPEGAKKTITRSLEMRTGPSEVYFEDEPFLHTSAGYKITGGRPHGGVVDYIHPQSGDPIYQDQNIRGYRELHDPKSPHYDAALMGAVQANFPGEVRATGAGEPTIYVPYAKQVGPGSKGLGVKQTTQAVVNVEKGRISPTYEVAGVQFQASGITGEVKDLSARLFGAFSSWSPGQQEEILNRLYPGEQYSAMREYAKGIGQGATPSLEELTVAYGAGAGKTPALTWGMGQSTVEKPTVSPWQFVGDFYDRFRELQSTEPEYVMQRYGEGVSFTPDWHILGNAPKDTHELYRQSYDRGLLAMGVTDPKSRERLVSENFRIRGTEVSWRSPYMVGTVTTPVIAEHMTGQVRLGYPEVAAMNYLYPTAAAEVGLGVDQGPFATGKGVTPRSAMAWRQLGQIWSLTGKSLEATINPAKAAGYHFRQRVIPNEATVLTQEEIDNLYMEMAKLPKDATLEDYGRLIKDIVPGSTNAPMAHPTTRMLFPRPETIQDVSTEEGIEPFTAAVGKLAGNYGAGFSSFLAGDTFTDTNTAMFGFGMTLRGIAEESKAKELGKITMSRYLSSRAVGGRYLGTTAVGMDEWLLHNPAQLRSMFIGARRSEGGDPFALIDVGGGEKKPWIDVMQPRAEEGGFIPAVMGRYPNLGYMGGVQSVGIMTPQMVRAKYGFDVPMAGYATREQIIEGDFFAGGFMGGGYGREGMRSGDWDADIGWIVNLMRTTESGLVGTMDPNIIKELTQVTPKEALANMDKIMTAQMGDRLITPTGKEVRSPGGKYSIYTEAWTDIAKGQMDFQKWLGAETSINLSMKQMWEQGYKRITSSAGAGISYNIRQMFEAASNVLGFSDKQVAIGQTGAALSYQPYIDFSKASQSRLESLMSNITISMWRDEPEIKTKFGGDVDRLTRVGFGGIAARTMANAVIEDVQTGEMTPSYAAWLFSTPKNYDEALSKLESGTSIEDVFFGTGGLIEQADQDLLETPFGLGLATTLASKIEGTMGKPMKRVAVPGEEEKKTLKTDYGQRTLYMTKDEEGTLRPVSINSLAQLPRVAQATTLYKAARHHPLDIENYLAMSASAIYRTEGGIGTPTNPQGLMTRYVYSQQQIANISGLASAIPGLVADVNAGMGKLGLMNNVPINANQRALAGEISEQSIQWRAEDLEREMGLREGQISALLNNEVLGPGMRGLINEWESARRQNKSFNFGAPPSGQPPRGPTSGLPYGLGGPPPGGGQQQGPGGSFDINVMHQHLGGARSPYIAMRDVIAGDAALRAYEQRSVDTSLFQRFTDFAHERLGGSRAELQALMGTPEGIQEIMEPLMWYPELRGQTRSWISKNLPSIRGMLRTGTTIERGIKAISNSGLPPTSGLVTGLQAVSEGIPRGADDFLREETNLASVLAGYAERDAIGKSKGPPLQSETIAEVDKRLRSFSDALQKAEQTIGDTEKSARHLERAFREIPRAELAIAKDQERQLRAAIDAGGFEGAPPFEADELAATNVLYMREAKRIRTLERQIAQEEKGVKGNLAGGLRKLFGGWGLFYMGHLVGLGTASWARGYPEYQQLAAEAQAGMVRADEEALAYASPEIAYQQAMLRSGGGTYAQLRRASAGAMGSAIGDLGGAAMTGLGASILTTYVADAFAAVPGLGGLANRMTKVVPEIGVLAAMGGFAFSQYANAVNRPDTLIQAGSQRDNWLGNATAFIKGIGPGMSDMFQGIGPSDPRSFDYQAEQLRMWREQFARGEVPGTPFFMASNPNARYPLTQEQMLQTSLAFAGAGYESVSMLPPSMQQQLSFQFMRAGINVQEMPRYGSALMAGMPLEEIAAYQYALEGDRYPTQVDITKYGVRLANLDEKTAARMKGGLEFLLGTPGGRTIYEQEIAQAEREWISGFGEVTGNAPRDVGLKYADISESLDVELFQKQAELAEARRQAGFAYEAPDTRLYEGRAALLPSMRRMIQNNLVLQGRGFGLQQQLTGMGMDAGLATYQVEQLEALPREQAMFGMGMYSRMAQGDPMAWTMVAMDQGMFGSNVAALTNMDVGLTGGVTGLRWGTTSLYRAGFPGTQGMTRAQNAAVVATSIWGDRWKDTDWGRAAVEGYPTPKGDNIAGTRGLQWYMNDLQFEAQMAQAGIQMQQLQLSYAFQTGIGLDAYSTVDPRTGKPFNLRGGGFWGIQDRQMALQFRQQEYNFAYQQEMFGVQGRQFYENMALNMQQAQMQRGWARQDWGYQDQVRGLQWQWQVEDFQENIRFMSGRERKLAERQMDRATTMHGIEGERIDVQRKRQQEMWKLEDERFNLQKKHFEEVRELEEERMEKTIEFYEENKKLQEEQLELSRAYFIEQHELQEAAIGAQAGYAKAMHEANQAMMELADQQEDYDGLLKVTTANEIIMINVLGNGIQALIARIPKMLNGANWPGYNPGLEGWTQQGNPIGPQVEEGTGGVYIPPETDEDEVTDGVPKGTSSTSSATLSSFPTINASSVTTLFEEKEKEEETINIYIGNELLGSYIIDKTTKSVTV